MVKICVVHLIRALVRFVSYGDRKKADAGLKKIHAAPNEETALAALAEFEASAWGAKHPQTVATWTVARERFTPFLQFPPILRRVIYTTNSIESLNTSSGDGDGFDVFVGALMPRRATAGMMT